MHSPAFILAFGTFGSIWMLLWGLGAVVPVVIHLWSRRRHQEVPWAAMEYLLAALKNNARRMRIEQLLLLAVRVGILLLLALALADPFVSRFAGLGQSLVRRGHTHRVLVLDGSFSMAARQGPLSRFQHAKQLAVELVENGTQGDGFTVVLAGDRPEAIIASPAFDPGDVIEEIEAVELPHAGMDLSATIRIVRGVIAGAAEEHPRLTDTKVSFLTDLQRNGWSEATAPAGRDSLARLAESASLELYDVAGDRVDNVAVTAVAQLDALATVAEPTAFRAVVRNFGAESRDPLTVEMLVDGRRAGSQTVRLEPQGQKAVSFKHRFLEPGEHAVEIRTADDLLPIDDRRFCSVPVRTSIGVLCVAGQQRAGHFLARALEPAPGANSKIRVQVVPETALLELDLGQFDSVFLMNIGRFGADESGVLRDFLAGGGGLVFFLGDRVDPENYNRLLAPGQDPARVLPGRIGKVSIAPPIGRHFDPKRYDHPIVEPFRGTSRTLEVPTIWRHFPLTPFEPSHARTALWLDNGDAMILTEHLGGGRVVLCATGADDSLDRSTDPATPWNNLATSRSFVALAQRILEYSLGARVQARNLSVHQDMTSTSPMHNVDRSLTVTDPGGETQRIRMAIDADRARWTFSDTRRCGIYSVELPEPAGTSELFAVNVDTRESDLERVEAEELPPGMVRELKFEPTGQTPHVEPPAPWPLFRILLGLLLALVLFETFLARHLGNP